MHKLKKMLAVLLAVSAIGGGVSMTVNAKELFPSEISVLTTSYDTRDVQRDGDVDVADFLRLSNHLNGLYYTEENAILDANANSIVSAADLRCILNGAINLEYKCQVEGYNGIFTHSTTNIGKSIFNNSKSQHYAKYTYSSHSSSDYYLNITENNVPNGTASTMNANEDGIIGADTRYADANEGIVWLKASDETYSTGFIVGNHTIATAAHCVYAEADSKNQIPAHWRSGMEVYFSDSDGKVNVSSHLTAREAHIPYDYYNSANCEYDYALITVNEDLSEYYHFNLGIPYNIYTNDIFGSYAIYVTGFPYKVPGGEENTSPKQMYTGVGDLVNAPNVFESVLCFSSDLTRGNSGGPVYVKEKVKSGTDDYVTTNTVISICSSAYVASSPHYNVGPIMNAMMLKFYLLNPNISY